MPADLTGWVQIDEGTGDKYNLCQSHYFDGGLYNGDGIPRYKLVNGVPVLRSDEEIEADKLPTLRAAKHAEISAASEAAIYAGMDVTTTQGTEHFSLTEKDQINLTTAKNAVDKGAAAYPFPHGRPGGDTGAKIRRNEHFSKPKEGGIQHGGIPH